MKKAVMTTFSCLFLAAALSGAAYAQELILGGQVVGIQIRTEGVMVAGVAEVETAEGKRSPASEAGFCQGDLILEAAGQKVVSAGELIERVNAQGGAPVQLKVQRKDKVLNLTVEPALSGEGRWMLGMWLRDAISGIGTVTFSDPATGLYGALGHSISDCDTGLTLPLNQGSISEAEIVSINKGAAGAPGELNGCADLGRVLGTVDKNTVHGIYGKSSAALGTKLVETGEICTGKATIISTISGRQAREYQAEINRVYSDGEGTHVMLTVTDPELCAQTGGIVQGMSGSPIMQNGRLVGAVTHVFVNDPSRGYGISIQDMLKSAGIEDQAA